MRSFLLLMCVLWHLSYVYGQTLYPMGLPVGSDAPNFEALTKHHQNFKLSDYLGRTDVTLIFLRDKTCPVYKPKVNAMQDSILKTEKNRRLLVVVSKDSSIVNALFKKHQINPYEVVWIPTLDNYDIHRTYGTLYGMDYQNFKFYADKGYRCLTCGCGVYYCSFSMPSVIVVDRKGKISYNNINDEKAEYPFPSTLLELLSIIRPNLTNY